MLDYQTVSFPVIGLLEYRLSDWRILETVGLSDIGPRPQSSRLSDIGLTKKYRLPSSVKHIYVENITCIFIYISLQSASGEVIKEFLIPCTYTVHTEFSAS
jgi:hypothetical protein